MCRSAVLLLLCLGTAALAGGTVSASRNSSAVANDVEYAATTRTICPDRASAMDVYGSPGELLYEDQRPILHTSGALQIAAVHHWDDCIGGSIAWVPVQGGGSDSAGQVTVSAPQANSTVSPTVQYVASATSSCAKGVAAMGIYTAPGVLAYATQGAQLNTLLELKPGTYRTVVEEWDNCGGAAVTPVTITVGGGSKAGVFSGLQQQKGWTGYGLLPPLYNICSTCQLSGPEVTWSMNQNISSPSISSHSALMRIGGQTAYSDVLWNNHLIGDFSSQGIPDFNHQVVPNLHYFTYDVYFYATNLGAAQALEFDINQFVDGYSFIWGHQCRMAGNEWDIWDNPGQTWHPTGIPCKPWLNAWNHLTIMVQRTPDNHLLFRSITLNGTTSILNYYDAPTASTWYGVTINYQQDGNYQQTPYSIWLDNVSFAYW